MSLTNGKKEAAKPRIPKKRVLTAAELRSKASYRAMERLLEISIDSEEQLWSIARIMSGEEFLAASEERCLAGMCGNALCSQALPQPESKGNFHIDALEKKVYAAVEGPGYCGVECAAASKAFAHRLGGGGQAMHRFELLLEQLREKKRKQKILDSQRSISEQSLVDEEKKEAKFQTTANAAVQLDTPGPPPYAAPAPVKPKGVLKKKSDLAAGSVKVPIMTAEVIERDPLEGAAEPPKPPSARKTHAVEGYVPKAALRHHRQEKKEGRRVRFSDAADEEDSENTIAKTAAAGSSSQACEISPSGYGWQKEEGDEEDSEEILQKQQQQTEEQVQPILNTQPAVFVLDVEDAEGPIEGAEHALSSKFGRLRVANEDEVQQIGVPVPETSVYQQINNSEDNSSNLSINAGTNTTNNSTVPATATASAPTGAKETLAAPSVDEILTERLRQGASKYFPQLAATLPPELAQTLEETASEAGSSEAESAEEWMLSDTDSDDDLENIDNSNGFSNGRFSARPTLFGQLVTNLDAWVTDSTVNLLQSGPNGSSADGNDVFTAARSSSSSSVPEIETALSRFISFALPPVMEKLMIDMPKGDVERNLMELIKTLRLVSALPAFMSSQWQLVVMMFLKALSIERVPGLRPAFETRDGVHRVNQILTANAFTIEEFVAVLEILLEAAH